MGHLPEHGAKLDMGDLPREVIMAISPDSYVVLFALLWLGALFLGVTVYLFSNHALMRQHPGEKIGWSTRWISFLTALVLSAPLVWYAQVFCSEQFCVMTMDGPDIVLQFEIPPREVRAGYAVCGVSLERGMLFGRRWCRIIVKAPPNDYYYGHLIVCEEAERALERYREMTGQEWNDKR